MSSEYAVWFAAHKDELWLGDISENVFFVLDQFLGSEIAVANVASQLSTGRTPADEEKIRRQLLSLVVTVVQFFPEAHSKLIELSKETFSVDNENFGWALRDTHDGLEAKITEILNSSSSTKQPVSDAFSSLQSRWTNFHVFNAKSCTAGVANLGERFLIPAAEKSLEAKSPGSLQLQFYTPTAAAWFAYAAPAVLAKCRSNAPSGWREAASGDKLWKGQEGFSEERWAFWKARLEELRTQGELDDDTTALMRQAFVAMGKAERAKKGKN